MAEENSSYEALAKYHYNNFSQYLGQKTSSTAANFQAKNKLAKLTRSQFSELATDVNDEVERRKQNYNDPLPYIKEFPVKRNQAREKLSTLNEKRFKDLAADVLGELTRRYPSSHQNSTSAGGGISNVNNQIVSEKSPSEARTQASTVSTQPPLVPAPRSVSSMALVSTSNISSALNAPNYAPNSKFQSGSVANITTSNQDNQDKIKIREYEQRMAEYQAQITEYELKNLELETSIYKYSQLKKENEKLKADFERLKISEESTKEAHKEIEAKYHSLEEQFQGLKEDYGNQEQMTLAIRVEANSLLEEVKGITNEKETLLKSYNELKEENKRNLEEMKRLKEENNSLLKKLSGTVEKKAKDESINNSVDKSLIVTPGEALTQESEIEPPKEPEVPPKQVLQNVEAVNSVPKEPSPVDAKVEPTAESENETEAVADVPQPRMPNFAEDTAIPKQKTFAYEEALQELFLNAEMQESTGVLISMKEIVLACKSITECISQLEAEYPDNNVIDSKADLSQALTKLMGLAKTHAGNPTEESLHDLYSLSSNLTSVLENIVNSFKSADGKDEYRDPSSENQPYTAEDYDYYDPSQVFSNDQLKEFLEEQTDVIVRSIQTLLNSMRQPGPYGDEFTQLIRGILSVVDDVIDTCRPSMLEIGSNPQLVEIFDELYTVSRQLESFGSEMVGPGGQSNKQLKQKMASSSYEIAKFVKELLTFLES